MPSTTHDGLVRLFDQRPGLAAELLRECMHADLPSYARARVEKATLTQARSVEFHADLVVSYRNTAPLFAVIVEVQLRRDPRKLLTWPVYVPSVRARLGCPVILLVVTPNPGVARWAREPIVVGPGTLCTPMVLGPETVPAVTRRREAIANPELAVLSVVAHGRSDHGRAVRIARAAASGIRTFDEDTALLYFTAIREALSPAARKAFEMIPDIERFLDSATRKKIQRGRFEGRVEGRTEGVLRTKRDAVLAVLRARRLSITERQRARVVACSKVTTLDAWLRRAATATSAAAVFARRSSKSRVG